jgi:DNA polymerase I
MPKPRLFLIDGHALCYRSFYAIRDLTTSKGQPTNAVYGFVMALRKIFKQHSPDFAAVCFDSRGRTNRQEKFEAYKIHRPSMPEGLISQIPMIKEVVRAYSIGCYEREGYEADDLLAGLARWAVERKHWDVVIVSEDKDLYQLAGPHISFLNQRDEAILNVEAVTAKWGFEPRLIADFLALAGDTSDNIPGVKGVGKVTARKLIAMFGGVSDIYRNLEQVTPVALREKLRMDKDRALLSRELVVLDETLEVEPTEDDLRVEEVKSKRLVEIFKDLEFRKLVDEYSGEGTTEILAISEADIEYVEREVMLEQARRTGRAVVYFTSGQEDEPDRCYCYAGGKSMARWNADASDESLGKHDFIVVTHDVKSFLKYIKKYGIVNSKKIFDTMLAGYLLGSAHARLSIQHLAWDYLTVNLKAETPWDMLTALWDLYPELSGRMKENKLEDLLTDLEQPLAETLFKMQEHGVALDTDFLNDLSVECQGKMEEMISGLHEMVGKPFNVNSPKQLAEILFVDLKLPSVKKTKTGFSTDEEVLQALAPRHALPAMILEYRQMAKLKSTYIDALPKMVDAETGRIHGIFDQAGTETGRLSSRQPNLQNIPIRTETGRLIRRAITATQPDYALLSADYSQIELRVLAHLSADDALIEAFIRGDDIHQITASQIFDVDLHDVDYQKRDAAKRVNFGIIYGMSGFGLAKDLGISQPEAQDFIDRYFLRYPKVRDFMDRVIAECEASGYVTTLMGRRRYIADITSSNNARRQYARRQAINTPVQGTAADLIKLAMIQIDAWIGQEDLASRLMMSVHDELVFDVAPGELELLVPSVRGLMERAMTLSVPVVVNLKSGVNWLDMKDITA